MARQPGETSREMRTLGRPNPAERNLDPHVHETAIQTTGRRHRWTGAGILAGVFVTSLTAAFLADGQVFHAQNAQVFAFLSLAAVLVTGALFLTSGLAERRQQHQRAVARASLAKADAIEERVDLIVGLVSPIVGRLAAIEEALEKVKQFEDGVELGADVRRALMGHDSN
jgi:hypothetical protein